MTHRSLCVLVLAVALPWPVLGCELGELAFLAADDEVHYEFTQRKTVAALSRPLHSSGVLGLSAGRDLIWQTLTPLKSTLVINAAGLQQFDRNDVLVSEIDLPVARTLAQVFLGILSGDTRTLTEAFTQSLSCDGDAWQLTLLPSDPAFAQLLSSITVSGAATLQTLAFREARGDYTEIQLSAPLQQPLDQRGIYLGN